jgi:NAD(P)-dependent dehydrogenase (short-subunit alcohol dehydrogenase family)
LPTFRTSKASKFKVDRFTKSFHFGRSALRSRYRPYRSIDRISSGIDFVINTAATYADKGFDSDRAMWHNGFDTNLFGHVMLARQAEHLKRSPWPSITYFSSERASA